MVVKILNLMTVLVPIRHKMEWRMARIASDVFRIIYAYVATVDGRRHV